MKKKAILSFALVLMLAGAAFGQTSLTSTTLSAAVTVNDRVVSVASATGISAPATNASLGSVLILGPETMKVLSVSSTDITVQRGYAGGVYAHASGATVYEATASELANAEPYGACTAGTTWAYTPLIVAGTGNLWTCTGSVWSKNDADPDPIVSANVGTAGTGVTATEYGTGRHHITKLTIAGTLAPASAADAEANGLKIYTFPAGAVIIDAASISVGLTGSGESCDADTPDLGLGTVIASGDTATLDGTGTFEDIMTGQTANDCAGAVELTTLTSGFGVEAAAAHTVHLNAADTWAAVCTITAAGTVWLEWTLLD